MAINAESRSFTSPSPTGDAYDGKFASVKIKTREKGEGDVKTRKARVYLYTPWSPVSINIRLTTASGAVEPRARRSNDPRRCCDIQLAEEIGLIDRESSSTDGDRRSPARVADGLVFFISPEQSVQRIERLSLLSYSRQLRASPPLDTSLPADLVRVIFFFLLSSGCANCFSLNNKLAAFADDSPLSPRLFVLR